MRWTSLRSEYGSAVGGTGEESARVGWEGRVASGKREWRVPGFATDAGQAEGSTEGGGYSGFEDGLAREGGTACGEGQRRVENGELAADVASRLGGQRYEVSVV